jgi:hypothetical protein
MNIRSGLSFVANSRLWKLILVLIAVSMIGLASASVYVYYYVSPTSTVKAPDVTLAAGSDASGSCTVYPCATVSISGTSDTATVSMSMFKADSTFTPPPSSYYSNLIQVKDATNAHSIKSVQILGISSTRAADFGTIIVYYCTAQTDFNPDGTLVTPSNCDSFSITSTTGGSVSGASFTFPVSITAGSTHYIELVAYAGSGGTVVAGDTIQFKIAVQWA